MDGQPNSHRKGKWTAATPYFPTGVYAIKREKKNIKAQKEWRGKKMAGESKGQTKQSLGD